MRSSKASYNKMCPYIGERRSKCDARMSSCQPLDSRAERATLSEYHMFRDSAVEFDRR